MRTHLRRPLLPFLAVALLAPAAASAYFQIDLKDGGQVLADSYVVEGEKLVVYRGTGSVQLDRASVKAIREHGTDMAPTESAAAKDERPAAAEAPAPATNASDKVMAPSAADVIVSAKDPAERANELTLKLILANRDLLFAGNRGDDEQSIKKRREDIKKIQKEREEVQKQLNR